MRVGAGQYRCESSKGDVVHVDQRLSREQVDVLLAVIARAGQTIDSTYSVELSEARQTVEWWHRPSLTRHVTELSWQGKA